MAPEGTFESAINLADLERVAAGRLPLLARDYYASGAHDELTLHDNQQAWRRLALRYRVLVDVSRRSAETTVLGHDLDTPILVAPTAFHKLAHPDGEVATAQAARLANTVMINSTLSTTRVEDVAAAAGPVWFQLYVYRDRAATEALVARAKAAGCSAIVLTVDAPLLGTRERDVRNRFTLPSDMKIENMLAAGSENLPADALESGLARYFSTLIDPALTERDVAWLAEISGLPIVVKGVVRGDDAVRAADAGAAAVVVSNHGGRQLDTSVATADALPEVVRALAAAGKHDVEVYVDGGIRRGTDVLKAISLGARAVLVGRPVLWGLAAGGTAGVSRALGILAEELDLAMALAGCASVSDITPDLVARSAAISSCE